MEKPVGFLIFIPFPINWLNQEWSGLAALGAYAVTVKAFLAFTNQNIQHVNVYFKSPYYMLRTELIK